MQERIDGDILRRIKRLEDLVFPQKDKRFLRLKEAASYLGIAIGTLRNMTSRQSIPHYKPRGKLIYFDVSEIEDWLAKNRVG